MSANFSISRDPLFGQISLLDFSSTGKEWSDVGSFWDDMISTGWVLDNLFRPNSTPFFTNLFGKAYQALNAVTLDMSASSKFMFVVCTYSNVRSVVTIWSFCKKPKTQNFICKGKKSLKM